MSQKDDLISRQAAIDAVCMEWCGVKHQDCKHPFDVEKDDYYWCDGCETVFRTLPELPSAEPEKVCIARINLSEEQVREAVERAKNEIVQVLPSAEPRWIPCSERLPEEDGVYLVTTSKGQVQVHVFNHSGNSEEYWMRCNKAWMPLPEPWKGDAK